MKIFIVGYMGSGKSTVGPKLGRLLNIPFFDLDKLIVGKLNQSVNSIFERHGELFFRKIEHQTLSELIAAESHFILATGGGTPAFHGNMELMNANGITMYLELSIKTICQRLAKGMNERPMLRDIKTDRDLEIFVEEHLKQRVIFYNQSRIVTSGLNLDVKLLAEQILSESDSYHSR